jgi:uncharacterized protein (DUF58 family)
MDKRSGALAGALGLVLALAVFNLQSSSAAILLVFTWLLPMLAVSAVVLWPPSARDQLAELRLQRQNCGERVELPPPSAPSLDQGAQISSS